jgi:uncharacterized membrane protein
MNRVALNKIQIRDSRLPGIGHWVRLSLLVLFMLYLVLNLVVVGLNLNLFANARWPDGLLLVFAAAATLASLTAQLPGQNVMLASMIITVMGGAVASLGALTGIPFGPYSYAPNIGQLLFYPLPWAVPVLWLIVILNSRGVARLILRPWRKSRTYGLRVIGLTVLLVALFDFCLEPFATVVKHYWVWSPTKLPLDWYGAPIVNFLGWAVSALLILAFVTPSLINKQPGAKHPPDYYPLVIWGGVSLIFLVGAASRHLWPAVSVTLAQMILVTTFALRGAWW